MFHIHLSSIYLCISSMSLFCDAIPISDSEVLIHGGLLLQGIVDKNIVGTSGGSIVHVTWLEKGWEETRSFMNQVQTVVNYWMVNTSYSVGVSDTVADATTINTIQATLDEAKKKVIVNIATLAFYSHLFCFHSLLACFQVSHISIDPPSSSFLTLTSLFSFSLSFFSPFSFSPFLLFPFLLFPFFFSLSSFSPSSFSLPSGGRYHG